MDNALAGLPEPIRLATIVLQKLLWFHQGGGSSSKQWADLLGVLKVQSRTLDLAYLQQWARTLGVSQLWQQALREVGWLND